MLVVGIEGERENAKFNLGGWGRERENAKFKQIHIRDLGNKYM